MGPDDARTVAPPRPERSAGVAICGITGMFELHAGPVRVVVRNADTGLAGWKRSVGRVTGNDSGISDEGPVGASFPVVVVGLVSEVAEAFTEWRVEFQDCHVVALIVVRIALRPFYVGVD